MTFDYLEKTYQDAIEKKLVPAVGGAIVDKAGNYLWKGTFGSTDMQDSNAKPFTPTTNFLIYSCTKILTSVSALQLLEQQKLHLDDPVEKYVPEIKDVKVLEGFDEQGNPKLREPKNKPTVLNLFTHSSGLSYDFFDSETLKWRVNAGQNPVGYVAVSQKSDFMTPFVHEPGAKYTYGVNTDYLGWIVEKLSGLRLDEYFKKHILDPLGMKNSGQQPTPGNPNLNVHFRGDDGKLTSHPEVQSPLKPEVVGGGHFLYSTLEDYCQFLATILNEGTHPKSGAKILEAETVRKYLFEDYIDRAAEAGPKDVGVIPSSIPQISNVGEFMPSVPKGWSCGLMLNHEDVPFGRQRGSGAWAGLANLYYWIDPRSGIAGFFVSHIFPFFDTEAMHLFDEMERAAYGKEAASSKGGEGSNHVITSRIEPII